MAETLSNCGGCKRKLELVIHPAKEHGLQDATPVCRKCDSLDVWPKRPESAS